MSNKLQIAVESCRDVTRLGRFAKSVDPVNWVAQLQAHLEITVSDLESLCNAVEYSLTTPGLIRGRDRLKNALESVRSSK